MEETGPRLAAGPCGRTPSPVPAFKRQTDAGDGGGRSGRPKLRLQAKPLEADRKQPGLPPAGHRLASASTSRAVRRERAKRGHDRAFDPRRLHHSGHRRPEQVLLAFDSGRAGRNGAFQPRHPDQNQRRTRVLLFTHEAQTGRRTAAPRFPLPLDISRLAGFLPQLRPHSGKRKFSAGRRPLPACSGFRISGSLREKNPKLVPRFRSLLQTGRQRNRHGPHISSPRYDSAAAAPVSGGLRSPQLPHFFACRHQGEKAIAVTIHVYFFRLNLEIHQKYDMLNSAAISV